VLPSDEDGARAFRLSAPAAIVASMSEAELLTISVADVERATPGAGDPLALNNESAARGRGLARRTLFNRGKTVRDLSRRVDDQAAVAGGSASTE
jgi:hypothetical protein